MEVKALVTELEGIAKQYGDIVKEFEGKAISAEKQAELKKLHTRGLEVKALIEAAKAVETERKDMNEIRDWLGRPAAAVPHPSAVNADLEGKAALAKIGWEFKGGLAYAPTSLGPVAMYPEQVLFGPVPTNDNDALEFYTTTRAAHQPLYRKSYGEYLRLWARSRDHGMAFSQLGPQEQKALVEGVDSSGGFLVPPDIQAELLQRTAKKAQIRSMGARVVPTSRDRIQFPRVAPHATSGSIYSSGFVGDWAGETPAFTDVDASFGQFEIPIKKLRIATKLSNDFIADAALDILAWLAANGAENMALVEDKGFIAGDGAALQPKGLLFCGAATVDVEGSTVNTISNTTAAAGTAPKILDLIYALPEQYADAAQFLMTRASEGKTRKLVDGQGRFHWPIVPGPGVLATGRELAGYLTRNSPFMPDDGVDTNKVYAYGDFGQYIIVQRAQITSVVLRERFADTDQTGIILFERVGGDVWNPDAFRFGVV
jgi:HK97 family phage major capsid protein